MESSSEGTSENESEFGSHGASSNSDRCSNIERKRRHSFCASDIGKLGESSVFEVCSEKIKQFSPEEAREADDDFCSSSMSDKSSIFVPQVKWLMMPDSIDKLSMSSVSTLSMKARGIKRARRPDFSRKAGKAQKRSSDSSIITMT
jgi:hypothetical protein